LVLAALSVCLVVTLVLALKDLVANGYRIGAATGGRESLEKAIAWNPAAWRARVEYAEMLRAGGDREGAIVQYEEAVAEFPGCPSCWIGIAEAQLALKLDPNDALDLAVVYGRSRTDIRTRAASIYARLGDDDRAAKEFAAAVLGKTDDRQDFFSLLTRIYGVDFVLERMVPDALLIEFLRFARAELAPDEARRVWQRYEPDAVPMQRHYYVGYLIKHGLVDSAWRAQFGASSEEALPTDLIDGRFEDTADYGWFGWHISDAPGVTATREQCAGCDDAGTALRLLFDGEHNPHYFGVRQDIPIQAGGSYLLVFSAQSIGVTSTSGVAVFVQGLPVARSDEEDGCALWVSSAPLRGDQEWSRSEIEFYVPMECTGIRLLVGRPESPHLNKFIGGEYWLDDVVLQKIAIEYAVSG
jgi:hypothetical protein